MVFKIIFSVTRKSVVKKNMSVLCSANDAERIIKQRFAEENNIENPSNIEILGQISQSNKGSWYALVQGEKNEHIRDEAEVEAENAKQAIEAIKNEYQIEDIFLKSVTLAGFEKKRKSA